MAEDSLAQTLTWLPSSHPLVGSRSLFHLGEVLKKGALRALDVEDLGGLGFGDPVLLHPAGGVNFVSLLVTINPKS